MINLDPTQVEAARQGNRAALDAIARAAEGPIYNLAIRMLGDAADAQDATQEILIKIITNLGGLRDLGAAGGWAMRIACRHLVNSRKRGRIEAMRLTFTGFAADLEQGLSSTAADAERDAETALAIEEIKIGCTLAMLTCLSRPLRIAYVLGDIFELTDQEAASVLEIAPAAYRQRLRRSRAAVSEFVVSKCGNVSQAASCRCEKRVAVALASGRIHKGAPAFSPESGGKPVPALRASIQQLEQGRRVAALMRSNPDFPSDVAGLIPSTIGGHDGPHGD